MTRSRLGCRSAVPNCRSVACLGLFAVAAMWSWGWALPRLARHDSIRQHIDHSERFGINPGAIYYTDIFVGDAFAPGRSFRPDRNQTGGIEDRPGDLTKSPVLIVAPGAGVPPVPPGAPEASEASEASGAGS